MNTRPVPDRNPAAPTPAPPSAIAHTRYQRSGQVTYDEMPVANLPLNETERARMLAALDTFLGYAGSPGDWGYASKLGVLTKHLHELRALLTAANGQETLMNRHSTAPASGDNGATTIGETLRGQLQELRDSASAVCNDLRAQRDELAATLDRLLNDKDCAAGAELGPGIALLYVKIADVDAARALLSKVRP